MADFDERNTGKCRGGGKRSLATSDARNHARSLKGTLEFDRRATKSAHSGQTGSEGGITKTVACDHEPDHQRCPQLGLYRG
jgi:hypothetical protein